jgi:hypothetical protein
MLTINTQVKTKDPKAKQPKKIKKTFEIEVKPAEKKEEPPFDPKLGAVMRKCGEAVQTANYQASLLNHQQAKLMSKDELHIHTLGRMVKYEGMAIVEEVWEYAVANMFITKINSINLGIKSQVLPVVNKKTKKTTYAHHTKYGHFISACEMDAEPIYYTGNFLVKENIEKLRPLLITEIQRGKEYKNLTDYFNLI